MPFRVAISPAAQAEAEATYLYLRENYPHMAAGWFNDLHAAIRSLRSMPERCGLAYEAFAFNVPVRQLLYGKAPHIYRVLFTVEEDEVRVHHVRHCRQRVLEPDELGEDDGS